MASGSRKVDPLLDVLDDDDDDDFEDLGAEEIMEMIRKHEEALAVLQGGSTHSDDAEEAMQDALDTMQEGLENAREKLKNAKKVSKSITSMSREFAPDAETVRGEEPDLRSSLTEKERVEQEVKTAYGPPELLDEELERLHIEKKRREKSVDICFLVDNTGSMDWCIEAVKTKLGGIMDRMQEAHPNALLRLAYVGYRDHGDVPKLELMPFTDNDPIRALKARLRKVKAFGGGDGPEDVVGGLQQVALLEWRSGTRLVIHFGDYPCHGMQYTSLPDDYPNGDPQGLTCEQFLAQLAAKRIDYHFARITDRTDRMVEIWKRDVFANAPGCKFETHDSQAKEEDFVPLVLRSISSSMSRSSYFASSAGATPTASEGPSGSRTSDAVVPRPTFRAVRKAGKLH